MKTAASFGRGGGAADTGGGGGIGAGGGDGGSRDAALWRLAGRDRRHDLLLRPVAETSFLVRRQIRPEEGAEPRNLEAHVGAAEITALIHLAEEIARRVAVGAPAQMDEVFAA